MLALKYRLKKQRDIDKVFASKKVIFGRNIIINFTENNLPYSRFTFVISKKVAKRAVDRNYFKRILRHIAHLHIINEIKGFDFVVVAKKESQQSTFEEIETEATSLFKKIRK